MVALELASPCYAALARRPRRSGVCRGVVAPGRAEAGAPLVLVLGLGVTVVPAAAYHFAPPGWTPAACVDLQQPLAMAAAAALRFATAVLHNHSQHNRSPPISPNASKIRVIKMNFK
uniref:Uncharacterized protein n=1 Tax=Oryza meridionalis TaxID=40149 RepID=A0A0E0D7J1_9ORYZ